MDFREYARGIKFNTVKPMDPPSWLEAYNTEFTLDPGTEVNCPIDYALASLCSVPKMSTYAIGSLINKAVRDLPDGQCFLNIGVWHGFTLLAGMLGNPDKKCIGVDNFSEFGGPRNEFRQRFMTAKSENHKFYNMDYKNYFKGFHTDQIGFYIYDASHDYDNQMQGLKLAEPFFADNCLIMVDDINWPDPYVATMDFMKQSNNNYEIVFEQKTACNCHPTFWNGILIIRKIKENDNVTSDI